MRRFQSKSNRPPGASLAMKRNAPSFKAIGVVAPTSPVHHGIEDAIEDERRGPFRASVGARQSDMLTSA